MLLIQHAACVSIDCWCETAALFEEEVSLDSKFKACHACCNTHAYTVIYNKHGL